MNYETARKLRDAGFPQEGEGKYFHSSKNRPKPEDFWLEDTRSPFQNGAYVPTLEELIDELGNNFYRLEKLPTTLWTATGTKDGIKYIEVEGVTDKEAVAVLYLALKDDSITKDK